MTPFGIALVTYALILTLIAWYSPTILFIGLLASLAIIVILICPTERKDNLK